MTAAGWARHLLLACGIAILLWSGVEDHDALAVSLLGALLALAATALCRPRALDRLTSAVAAGGVFGALASLATFTLMLFKDLRHAHAFPDYPPHMLLGMLERLPVWALAGGLAGLGCGILLRSRRMQRGDSAGR
ncbi:MAG: hypothetical protein OXE95_06020 [Chloroflexi bacterium]|nr:hypothetical protein [Chloroflexota bacterium]MCY4247120.1 hypothetical protein [Chloroflexota bacterium]